jgi:predicted dehydrogenase
MATELKIAIVGLGVIGKVHAAALKEQGKALYAVCDTDPEKLLAFPEALRFTDYETMLREAKPDAVHICTPHYLHAPMILSALEKNIHVLSEKPLCIHKEEIGRSSPRRHAPRRSSAFVSKTDTSRRICL